jgi:cobalamin synthase
VAVHRILEHRKRSPCSPSQAGWFSSIAGLLMSSAAMKNFGAVNGDVMGATNEISRPVVLIAMLLLVAL